MSSKSWRGVTLPGFSALTSSTHASWAAPATLSGLRTVACAVRAGPALPSTATKARVAGSQARRRRERGRVMAPTMLVGESLVGEGNEVAHVDLLIGSKTGPVGEAFAESLINQKEGHTTLLAVVAPNLPAKPDTIMSNKVTIKGATQAVQMFGPAQAAVARAVVDSVRDGVIAEGDVDDLCIICGVFIHWEATDDKKIFDYNYQATKEAIARALRNEPSLSEVLDAEAAARHPFAAGVEG